MNKIPGYDEAPSFTGESRTLPAGKYICVIKGASDTLTATGRRQFVLLLDIDEGEYKGFYDNRYRADRERIGMHAKWAGTFRQGYEGKQLPFFKGMMTSIEESNSGFYWGKDKNGSGKENWDEKTLKGKRIGVVFRREQFTASDGSVKWATKAVKVRSVQNLDKEDIPEDKLLSGGTVGARVQQGFVDLSEEENEDDLPF